MTNYIDNSQHYKNLGINQGANQEEIRQSFCKLAKIHHPMKGGNVEEFYKIVDAYEDLHIKTSLRKQANSKFDDEYNNNDCFSEEESKANDVMDQMIQAEDHGYIGVTESAVDA